MAWWSPDPRAIIELDGLHVARRLQRTIRGGKFRVTCDQDFSGVIQGCGSENGRQDATWITPEIFSAYVRLHRLGHAHSVEVWHEDRLAGGTYGVSIGGLFAAESKFYRVRDASKVAVVYLVAHLRTRGYRLLDIQMRTAHTTRLGATTIRRRDYLERLAQAVPLEVTFGDHLEGDPLGH
jgi:leucyl/phenylalanyl-tRNA--protein transferase